MKRVTFTMLLAAALFAAKAQYFPIDTARLSNTYEALLLAPESKHNQMQFFNAFPNNWSEFYDTYRYCDNEGYNLSMYNKAFEHIKALGCCTAVNDTLFCNKLIALSVGASLDADAPNYLQTLLHNTMQKKNDVFIHCLSKIEKGHQMQFWQFYWSNTIDGKSQKQEFEALYNTNIKKYPNLMKTMLIAFEYFNNGILFIKDFYNQIQYSK